MKYQVQELEGALLDSAVAKAEWGHARLVGGESLGPFGTPYAHRLFAPSSEWQHGGPIIERERIQLWPGLASSTWYAAGSTSQGDGPTPLIAAMRTYAAGQLGAEVELP